MSRFVFSLPQVTIPAATLNTPGLITPGAGLVINPTTGRVDVDSVAPTLLSGAMLSGDLALIFRNLGTGAAPNWATFAAGQAAVQAWAGASGSTATPSPTPTATPSPTPTPTPTSSAFASPLTFTGAAGALTGAQVLMAYPGSTAVNTASRDGSGNFLPPTAAYNYGMLEAAGSFSSSAVSSISAVFASGKQGPITIGYMDAAGQNGGFVVFGTSGGDATIFVTVANGTQTTANSGTLSLAGATSVGISRAADGSWHAHVNGTVISSASGSLPTVTTAYVLIGAGDTSNASTAISQITVQ